MREEQTDMQLALTLNPFVDTDLLYAQQLGIDWIVADVPAWDLDTLAAARNRVQKAGLHLAGLKCLPASLLAPALSGQVEGKAALEGVSRILIDLGELGIPSVGYQWPPGESTGLPGTTQGRGDAESAVFPLRRSDPATRQEAREAQWRSLAAFLEGVLLDAETAGVRLAYRMDLASAALPADERILDSVSELDHLFELASSPFHGLDIDYGFITQALAPQANMAADEILRHFGLEKRLFAVRMRHLRTTGERAHEAFLDEDKVAALKALQACRDVEFEGPLSPIPSPNMSEDTAWRHKHIAFATGYLRGLLQAIG
jgi:D-mannonate dehydratase